MKLYIVHYYDDSHYEERLEIKAVCTSENRADEICAKLNVDREELFKYCYVEIESDEEIDDNVLYW